MFPPLLLAHLTPSDELSNKLERHKLLLILEFDLIENG